MPGASSQFACCDWVLPPPSGGLMPMRFLHGELGLFGVQASTPTLKQTLDSCISSPVLLNPCEACQSCFLVFSDLAGRAIRWSLDFLEMNLRPIRLSEQAAVRLWLAV